MAQALVAGGHQRNLIQHLLTPLKLCHRLPRIEIFSPHLLLVTGLDTIYLLIPAQVIPEAENLLPPDQHLLSLLVEQGQQGTATCLTYEIPLLVPARLQDLAPQTSSHPDHQLEIAILMLMLNLHRQDSRRHQSTISPRLLSHL